MKQPKLSRRAKLLLAIVRERSLAGDGRYYVPRAGLEWPDLFAGESLYVSGSGDAAILKSFIKRGWAIAKPLTNYSCEITEAGIAAYEALRTDPDVLAAVAHAAAEQDRLRKEALQE